MPEFVVKTNRKELTKSGMPYIFVLWISLMFLTLIAPSSKHNIPKPEVKYVESFYCYSLEFFALLCNQVT